MNSTKKWLKCKTSSINKFKMLKPKASPSRKILKFSKNSKNWRKKLILENSTKEKHRHSTKLKATSCNANFNKSKNKLKIYRLAQSIAETTVKKFKNKVERQWRRQKKLAKYLRNWWTVLKLSSIKWKEGSFRVKIITKIKRRSLIRRELKNTSLKKMWKK